MPELPSDPLRRGPDGADDDSENEKDLSYEKFRRCHRSPAAVFGPEAQPKSAKDRVKSSS